MKHQELPAFRRIPDEPVINGNLFKRSLTIRAIASMRRMSIADVAGQIFPHDRNLMQLVTRATSAPATTFTTGWAAELVHTIVADTLDAMGAASAAAEVMRQSLTLDWNGAGVISAPGFVASASAATFVKEGDPIPVRQLSEAPAQLLPYKLATISALTREMVDGSNAEALISDALVRSMGLGLDSVFFGNAAAVTNTQPAGIRNGISTSAASASTDPFGGFFEDVSTLINAVSAVGGNGPFILVTSAGRLVSGQGRFPGKDEGSAPLIIPIASSQLGSDIMIAIAPQGLVAALSAEPEIEAGNAATIVMDTAPVTPDTTQPTKSMWQTNSIALKVRWPVTWALRDSRAVAWLTPAWK
jgi:Phage capsid family